MRRRFSSRARRTLTRKGTCRRQRDTAPRAPAAPLETACSCGGRKAAPCSDQATGWGTPQSIADARAAHRETSPRAETAAELARPTARGPRLPERRALLGLPTMPSVRRGRQKMRELPVPVS
eukprot:3009757-Prymnesium_polylepis.1